MDLKNYLQEFQKASNAIDRKLLSNSGIEIQTGIWLNSVVMRLQKRQWANTPDEKPHSGSAIFMGIWMDQQAIEANKLLYNIHALRLRQLEGYKLQSRAFATSFREKFKQFEHQWTNVSVNFGPQTLMQGWLELDSQNLQKHILDVCNNFFEIEHLVDETLSEFK